MEISADMALKGYHSKSKNIKRTIVDQKDQMCNIELIPVKAYPISLRIYILEVSQPEAAQCCVMILTVRDNMLTVPR